MFFFNDLFVLMGNPRRVNQYEAQQAIVEIDKNSDGQADKQELFLAFRQILSSNSQSNNSTKQGYGNNQSYS